MSPPNAYIPSRNRMREEWTGPRISVHSSLRSVSTSAISPPLESEPAPIPSPVTPVDPPSQLLADMAWAFKMDLELEDGSGPRLGTPSSPVIEVQRHAFNALNSTFIVGSDYQFVKELGEGASGRVIAAKHLPTGEGCAIKKITNINTNVCNDHRRGPGIFACPTHITLPS